MDLIDLKIIEYVQKNAKMTMKEIAQEVHLSAPAVIERVKKLEEQHVIEGYKAQINLKKVGRFIQAIVLFQSKDCKALAQFCQEHEDVLACYRVAGEISYIAHVATESVEMLEEFIDASMEYGTPSTNIVLSFTKKESIKPIKKS
ncbi:MAG: Lrp/AsnC family transcriptional regulator [Kurthia sp.]|nr:Lrp/AsnC family transcriptional regulator [Candidatus Kurthia equi]